MTEPAMVVHNFIDAINHAHIDIISSMMAEDHLFIDSLGGEVRGRETMIFGWKGYFAMVPDYRIDISEIHTDRNTVSAFGVASGTYTQDSNLEPANHWQTPAAWRAEIEDGLIKVWQVYADNEPIRQVMSHYGHPADS